MENTNIEEKKSNKVIFGLKIAGNVIFYAVIILLLIFSIMNIKAGSSNGGFPNIFGKGFLAVKTNSMERDTGSGSGVPSYYDDYSIGEIKKNDLVYEKVLNSKSINNLKVGDVITFFDPSIKALNTHRIVRIEKDENNVVNRITCQGDYSVSLFGVYDPVNGTPSTNQTLIDRGDIQIISDMSNVKGVVTGVKSGAGKVILNIQQNWLWYFVLPVLVFLLIEIFMVVKNIMDLKGAKQKAELASNKEVMMADLEAQKEEMRKQILAELKAQQAALDEDKKKDKVEDVSDDEEAELESPAVSVVVVEKPESNDDVLNNEMIEESAVLEEVEPVENKEPEVETPKKASTTKKTTTTKKSSSSTKNGTTKKTTTTKKSSSSTKSGTTKKSTTTKKSSTGTKKAKSTDSSVENKEE